MQKNLPYLSYILNFRGFAILLIVTYHIATAKAFNCSPDIRNIFISISANGTILFVFIAGFLFYYLFNTKFTYKEYLLKKLKFVIMPYIVISIPLIIDKLFLDPGHHWWMNEGYNKMPVLNKALYMLITGKHSGPLWFIPMISIYYILAPVFIRLSKNKYFHFSTLLIFCLGLFTVSFGYYSNSIISFVHFLPIYFLGIWACKFREVLFQHIRILFPLVFACYLLLTTFEIFHIIDVSNYLKLRDAGGFSIAFNFIKLKAILLCFAGILFFYQFNSIKWKTLSLTGNYSFGIFFIHLYVIEGIKWLFHLSSLDLRFICLWGYPTLIIATIAICILIIKVLKLLLKDKSRMIIGS